MKTTIILVILTMGLIAQNKKHELGLYNGKVRAFANTNLDFTNSVIDTIVNQTRTINFINDSLIEVGWQLENNDPRLYYQTYKIDKEYIGTITDQNTHLQTDSYHYLMFDSEGFPLLIVMAIDKSYCNIYYWWESKRKAFLKVEKVVFL